MDRVLQEFYCGECDGYFRLKLNVSLNYEVEVQCPNPKCKHLHRRCVVDGQIYEQGRYKTDKRETLIASDATYSKTPVTQRMREAHDSKQISEKYRQRRDGVPIEDSLFGGEVYDDNSARMDRWASLASKNKQ
jgi:hypothetical protein